MKKALLPDADPGCYRGQQMLVVGLGLSGISALRYLVREAANVVVTDSRSSPAGIDALRAEFPQVEFCLGRFSVTVPLSQISEAVVSPGVSLDEPFVRELMEGGVSIIGDVELFARAVANGSAAVVGITGSNGKSTVTSLLAEMARAAAVNVAVGGNLGVPALELIDDSVKLYVLELSSFQLETTRSLSCAAAAFLNLSEDHLDRHHSIENYRSIKARIFERCDAAITNREDAYTWQGAEQAPRHISVGQSVPGEGEFGLRDVEGQRWLCQGQRNICPQSSLKIQGLHNSFNALAALALAAAVNIPEASCVAALKSFPGLPHRCEFIAERRGVTWLNDSKGTNVGSTLAALKGLDSQIVWLGGGQGKGQDFQPLRAPLADKARAALLFGQDAALIERCLMGAVTIVRNETLIEALSAAKVFAQAGDTVLLSPACASLDQFANYVERGDLYRAWVQENA